MAIGVGEYFPQDYYGGGVPGSGSFEQQELANVYGQSFDQTQLSLAAFKNYLGEADKTSEAFKGRLGILEVQAERLREDFINAPSLVQVQVKQALDRNMKNQATVAASMQGPVARVNALLMTKNAQQTHDMAVSGVGEFIKEDIARKSMYWQQIAENNKSAIQALGGLSQAQMNGMNITANFTSSGLRTALDAASAMATNRTNRMQQEIQRDQLQNTWNQALLDSETNIAMSTLEQSGGIEQAMIRAQTATNSSYINAWSRAYGDTKRHEAAMYRTQMGYATDMYKINMNDMLQRDLGAQAFGLDLARMDQNAAMAELQNQQLSNLMGMENSSFGGALGLQNRQRQTSDLQQMQDYQRQQQQFNQFVPSILNLKDQMVGGQ